VCSANEIRAWSKSELSCCWHCFQWQPLTQVTVGVCRRHNMLMAPVWMVSKQPDFLSLRSRSLKMTGLSRFHGRLMKWLGHSVEAFSSAADFLASPRLVETACLITDGPMPAMTGIERYRHLIEMGTRYRRSR
jgi:hypothetical protein